MAIANRIADIHSPKVILPSKPSGIAQEKQKARIFMVSDFGFSVFGELVIADL